MTTALAKRQNEYEEKTRGLARKKRQGRKLRLFVFVLGIADIVTTTCFIVWDV